MEKLFYPARPLTTFLHNGTQPVAALAVHEERIQNKFNVGDDRTLIMESVLFHSLCNCLFIMDFMFGLECLNDKGILYASQEPGW